MSMEDAPSSNPSSPRLSFSQDFIRPNNPPSPPKPAYLSTLDSDFNFSVEAAAPGDPSPADELFLNGTILPLPLKIPHPNPLADPDPKPVNGKGSGGKRSLWKFGRSASLNHCAPTGMIKIKFLRSYSTGSDPNPKPQQRQHPSPRPRRSRSLKNDRGACGSYGADRIGSVPLFPKQRGLIGFLMCNCVGAGSNYRGMEY